MENLIAVTGKPAVLSFNFEQAKEALAEKLQKYEIVVTADTVADAKKLATELNKSAGFIDELRKKEIAKVSEPIKLADDQLKELIGMYNKGRTNILDQVKKFEDKTRETVRTLLISKCNALFEQHGVSDEFQNVQYDDLIKLTAITKTGKSLTAKVKAELEQRVLTCKMLQDRTERRLLALENASYKAGLTAPLTRDHVQPFLFAEDNVYQSELERIINAEIGRQQAAEEATRRKLEREAQAKAAREAQQQSAPTATAETKTPDAQPVQRQEPETTTAVTPSADSRTEWDVWCLFNIDTPPGTDPERIKSQLRGVMEKAGIKSLADIRVTVKQPQ